MLYSALPFEKTTSAPYDVLSDVITMTSPIRTTAIKIVARTTHPFLPKTFEITSSISTPGRALLVAGVIDDNAIYR